MLEPTTFPTARSGLPSLHGLEGDSQLRGGRGEGHDGEADDQRRQAHGRGDPASPAHKELATGNEGHEPGEQQSDCAHVHSR